MSFGNGSSLSTGGKIEEWVQNMVPEVVLAVESLELATPERVHTCLEKHNIKASRSETEMALEYGCKIGIMEEKRRYRLNPELRATLSSACGCSKRNVDSSSKNKSRMGKYCENDGCAHCSFMDCESEMSAKRPNSEDYYDEDDGDVDVNDSDFENDDD